MTKRLDDVDSRLLNRMQEGIPLVERPFAELGTMLGASEEEVLRRAADLKGRRVIRQISAIFDTKSLGYEGSLVAAKVEPSRIEAAAKVISEHPGVTHNYQRNHPYNLWYTVAVPPDSRLGLQGTVDVLHRRSGAMVTRMFPTVKLYKIGVSFDMTGATAASARSDKPAFAEEQRQKAMTFAVTEADKRMIRLLQQDLPLVARPYDAWAQQAGVSVDDLLAAALRYQAESRMRRFSAVLHHREAGISANGMGAWAVPPEKQDQFGATAASFAAVSHCYLRPTYEDWPYSIFTMVHGADESVCNAALAAISQATGVRDYLALFSSREFKKTRLAYFLGDIEAWEAEACLSRQTPA